MSNVATNHPNKNAKALSNFGMALTVVYLIGCALYAVSEWNNLLAMKPPEFATVLGGAFGPLAFLWLVLGFYQQGRELQNSAQALWLQSEELRNSVEQQRELVKVSQDQLKFEMHRIEAIIAEEKRRAQPDFFLTDPSSSSTGKAMSFYFQMFNRGRTCSDLRIVFSDKLLLRRPILESGDACDFSIEIPMNYATGEKIVQINYVDGLGEFGTSHITINAVERAGFVYLETNET